MENKVSVLWFVITPIVIMGILSGISAVCSLMDLACNVGSEAYIIGLIGLIVLLAYGFVKSKNESKKYLIGRSIVYIIVAVATPVIVGLFIFVAGWLGLAVLWETSS